MTSEAARQKYPDAIRGEDERLDDFEERQFQVADQREAYDAGRVDALREAAEEFRSGQITGIFYGRDDYTKAWLQEHADRVEREARG